MLSFGIGEGGMGVSLASWIGPNEVPFLVDGYVVWMMCESCYSDGYRSCTGGSEIMDMVGTDGSGRSN